MTTTIAKPVPAPTKPKKSLDDILASAEKKSSKASSHLNYPSQLETAAQWLKLHAQYEEAERELRLLRDQILAIVRPWHEETCAKKKAHEATVVVPSPAGNLRVSFQHRYSTIPLSKKEELTNILNGQFDQFFKKSVSVGVKKEIAEDPDKLEQMVMALIEMVGEDNFNQFFETTRSLVPTKTFTESCCQLPAETKQALLAAGVKQIVAFAATK